MAATIIATIKSETANSYVTLTEANSYFETVPDSALGLIKQMTKKIEH